MKRCKHTTTILGTKIRCKLPEQHVDPRDGDTVSPLADHEYWETRKVKNGWRNVMVRWRDANEWKYGKLQGEVRGGDYAGIK